MQYATLAAAAKAARAGDTVIVREGVYKPGKFEPPPGTAWIAADDELVVIDGGWDGKTATPGTANLVLFGAPDVWVEGFTIRNSPGDAVAINGNGQRATLRRCIIHNNHESGLAANGTGTPLSGLTILGNRFYDNTLSWKVDKKRKNVSGNVLFRWVRDSLVEDNDISGGFGEGLNCGIQSQRIKVYKNRIHTLMHLGLYLNRAQECHVWRNIIYHTYDPFVAQADGDIPHGVVIGDEERADGKAANWQRSRANVVEENVIAWLGVLLSVRNNASPAGYDTRIDEDTIIRRNTFISGPRTRRAIQFNENRHGFPAVGRFEDNIIHVTGDTMPLLSDAPRMRFRRNAWTMEPANMRDGDFVIPATALVNPDAPIEGDRYGSTIDLSNYYRRANGPLSNMEIGALPVVEEPPVDPPVDPPVEPPVDPEPQPTFNWRARLTEPGRVLVANCQEFGNAGPTWWPGAWLMGLIRSLADMLDELTAALEAAREDSHDRVE